jgi:hypothetical protein
MREKEVDDEYNMLKSLYNNVPLKFKDEMPRSIQYKNWVKNNVKLTLFNITNNISFNKKTNLFGLKNYFSKTSSRLSANLLNHSILDVKKNVNLNNNEIQTIRILLFLL